jgi:hypothetical protein
MAEQSSPTPTTAEIEATLRGCELGASWVDSVIPKLGSPDTIGMRAAYARAQRKLGGAIDPGSLSSGVPQAANWTGVDWARLWLLRRALDATDPAKHVQATERLFEGGELGEQVSLLRTLPLLPDPARFCEIAISACRTNAVQVFEAIACENPFPAAHFPQLNFNQLVMKAVFMEVALPRIVGLATRIDDELVRMARDFTAERKAAGRVVPADLDLITRASEA